jgi:GH25 family lysozyme M1 (1,4-beta-N-acetylmuramidase)
MLFGIDISHYQDGLDLHAAANGGMNFVWAKVSEGNTYQDPSWPTFRDAARAHGLLLAGYHYVRADVDPNAQAATFVAHLGDPTIPAMLDFEANSGDLSNFWAVLNAIEAHGVTVRLSYIPRWYWEQIGSPSLVGVPGLIASSYPSTAAGPAPTLYAAVTDSRWAPYGGATPAILQFTDAATLSGYPSGIDGNAFRGNTADLAALLGHTPSKRRKNRMQQLPATTMPTDPNTDPAKWPQRNYDVGFLGPYSFSFGCQEWGGRTKDTTRGFLYLASWMMPDGSLRPVDPTFVPGKGHAIADHWPTPAYTAPANAVGITLNYAAPGGAYVAES